MVVLFIVLVISLLGVGIIQHMLRRLVFQQIFVKIVLPKLVVALM